MRPRPFGVGPAVRVRAIRGPRGDTWYWRAECHRRRATVWTGWARPEAVAVHVVAALTRDPAPEPQGQLVTMSELLDAFVEDCTLRAEVADLRVATMRRYRSACRRVGAVLGAARLDLVDQAAVDRARNRLLRQYAPLTVSSDLRIVRIGWEWGRLVGRIADRPMPRVRVNVPQVLRHTPTAYDVGRALDALDARVPWPSAMVRLLYVTGARLSEVATLQWSDIGAERMVVHGKRGPRLLPLTPPVVEVLDGLPRRSSRVLGVAARTSAGGIHRYVHAACQRASVAPFTPQGLRRAAVDRLQRQGVDPGTACALLGHSPAVMLEKYRQASQDDLNAAAAILAVVPSPDNLIIPTWSRQ